MFNSGRKIDFSIASLFCGVLFFSACLAQDSIEPMITPTTTTQQPPEAQETAYWQPFAILGVIVAISAVAFFAKKCRDNCAARRQSLYDLESGLSADKPLIPKN